MNKFAFGDGYRITLVLACFRRLVLIVDAMLMWKVILGTTSQGSRVCKYKEESILFEDHRPCEVGEWKTQRIGGLRVSRQ
jgi:hypothetical protein